MTHSLQGAVSGHMLCDLGIKNSDLYKSDNVPGTASCESNNTVDQSLTESQKNRLAVLRKVSSNSQ